MTLPSSRGGEQTVLPLRFRKGHEKSFSLLRELSNRLANLVDGIFRGSSCLCMSDIAVVRDVGR
jgi:hypothetical protein